MVLVTVALVVVQQMCLRLGVYAGGLGGLIREQFSARSTFAALSLLAAGVAHRSARAKHSRRRNAVASATTRYRTFVA